MDNIDNEVEEVVEAPEESVEESIEAPEEPTEQVESDEAVEEDQPEEQEEPQPEVEEPQPSRREQLRVQKLLEKYGTPPDIKAPKVQGTLDYNEALEADEDTIRKFEADRQFASDAAFREGLQQSQVREWNRDVKYEFPAVKQKFEFMDPDSEKYDKRKADVLDEKYLRFVGFKPATETTQASVMYPDVSYLDFIESEMEFASELAADRVATSTKNIAKQAAQTGLRPDGSKAKSLNLNKTPETMTDEELDAFISRTLK
jgi:hypothetical protein